MNQANHNPVPAQRKRILSIDDERALGNVLKLGLESTGKYEVACESNPHNAVDAARKFHPDLILLDFIMPGLDGGEVSLLLGRDPLLSHVPIIVVTASTAGFGQSGSGVPELHGHLVLRKPVRLDALAQSIEDELAKAEQAAAASPKAAHAA
jgi:CheY-like chemotaxis protein